MSDILDELDDWFGRARANLYNMKTDDEIRELLNTCDVALVTRDGKVVVQL